MSAKAVKTLTVTGLGTYEVLEAQMGGGGAGVEDIDVSTFADATKAFVPHPQAELGVIPIKIALGTARPTVGSAATLTVAGTYDDNTTFNFAVAGYIKSANPTSVAVGGDRVPAWDVEFRPSGGGTTSTATTGAATTTTAAATTTTGGG